MAEPIIFPSIRMYASFWSFSGLTTSTTEITLQNNGYCGNRSDNQKQIAAPSVHLITYSHSALEIDNFMGLQNW